MQTYVWKEGAVNEQPWHLDGTVPWRKLRDGKLNTSIIALTDGPRTAVAGFMPDFWHEGYENDVLTDKVAAALANCRDSEAQFRRAGNLLLFPWVSFVSLLVIDFLFFYLFIIFFFRLLRQNLYLTRPVLA